MDRTVILAADRRARCAVEVPAKPEPAERTAGEELALYIGKLAGTPIGLHQGEKSNAPVRILVGARASVVPVEGERVRDTRVQVKSRRPGSRGPEGP